MSGTLALIKREFQPTPNSEKVVTYITKTQEDYVIYKHIVSGANFTYITEKDLEAAMPIIALHNLTLSIE